MNNYTNNGIANLASYGRGNDTELVHMTPGEVKGLQALAMAHGGSLTINPDTGLVEAGFLEQILPVVAAAGLTYLTAGAAAPALGTALGLGATSAGIVAGAGAGAVISGGFAAAQGKDVGQAALMGGLGGAISGGLGAYGDAGTFAADAAAKTGTQASTQTIAAGANASVDAAGNAISMVNPAGQAISSETGAVLSNSLNPNATQAGINAAALPEGAARNAALEQLAQNTNTLAEGSAQLPGQGIANTPTSASSYYSGLKPDQYIQKAGIQALPALNLLEEKQQELPGQEEDEYTRRLKGYKLSSDYKAYEAPRPNPYYRPSYAAEGGVMNSFDDEVGTDTIGMAAGGMGRGIYTDTDSDTKYQDALTAAMTRLNKAGKTAGIKATPLPKTSIKGLGDIRGATPEIERAAGGGIMSNLGGYSDGGRMLKGPGDGMSDSIPGVIGGKQPARLADGEFVVPADVVSHLGNGSTDAGAKKLYAMMDNIRKARTGKKKQAPEVNVDKYIPGKKKASGGIAGYAEGGTVGYAEGGVTYNEQLAANVQAAYNQGYSGAQIGAALIASGVSPEVAAAATGLDAGTIAQAYAGGADLTAGGKGIGNAAGNPGNPNPTPAPYTPGVVAPKPIVPIKPVVPTQTYTTQQYLDFLKASMAAGNSLEAAKQDIRNRYGATDADLYAMADLYNAQNKPVTPPLTPQEEDLSRLGTQPYRPGFVPRTTGFNVSSAAQDPYSNQGLESLYGQMMGQYAKPAPLITDADVRDIVRQNVGNGAEVGKQLINRGISMNQAISALQGYPQLTPDIINQAYLGGQALGGRPPPTLDTQYTYSDPGTYYRPPSANNLVLTRPIVDAAFQAPAAAVEAAPAADNSNSSGNKAGGLLAIKHRRRA